MFSREANRKPEKLYAFVKIEANMEMSSFILNIFIELACSEQDIVVTWLVGWLFWVQRPFETIFQSISGRLPKTGRKRRKDR